MEKHLSMKQIFSHIRGLLYKHITNSGQKFLALVIPTSWKYTVLVEAHDKLGHQGNTCTYCLIKCQYYWKGMNKATSVQINMLSIMNTDAPTSLTPEVKTHQHLSTDTSTSQPNTTPEVSEVTDPTPKSLTADRLEALLQMQETDPFCKRISKCLSNGKAP